MSSSVIGILKEVNSALNDANYIRWPKEELISYFNSARKAIILRRPSASSTDVDFVCKAGTKQVGPKDMNRLIDVPYNVDGPAIKGPYERKLLDDTRPDWRSGNSASEVQCFTYDERNPTVFNVFPGVKAGTKINLVYTRLPLPMSLSEAESGATTGLDAIWDNPLIDWILYRCYSKDAEYSSNGSRSMQHLNAFRAVMGDKLEGEMIIKSMDPDKA